MKSIPMALALALFATGAVAQTTAPTTTPSTTTPMTPAPGGSMAPMSSGGGQAAASGDSNQAVATTNANAMQPAHGANSFSRKEARRRIAAHGFTQVADLRKDTDGVWRGTAMMQGSSVGVWLDYKGNVGQK